MKKLLIMTGVAAFAFGAFAFSNGSGFDSLTAGEAFTAAGDNYWGALPSDLEATVTAYAGSGETAYATRPAYFTGDNVNFLAIESASAADPLVRYINESSTTGKDIGNGLYLDTLVQFTASTETMGTSDETAKLAIWAQTSDETPAVTNFVVQAGYVEANGGITSTNYVMTAPADFDFAAWHRLTVKAINDIDASANTETVGFVVFVDDNPLERAGDDIGTITLNSAGLQFVDAVLPSRRSSRYDDYQTLKSVGFSGNGKIDDVSFTDVAPDFAKTDIVFTLNIGEGVTGFTLNDTPYANLTAGDSVTLELAANVTVVTVANVTYAAGYRDAVLSDGNGGTIDDLEFNVTGDAPVATISAVRDNFYVGGKGYATLAAAVAAVSGESNTIALNGNYTLTEADYSTDLGADTVLLTDSVVIDLAGHTLTSLSQNGDPLFYLVDEGEASLTIVNSGATDGVIDATGYVVYNGGNGQVIFGQKTDTNYVAVNGAIANIGNLLIVKGKFDVESNTEDDECVIAEDMVAEGSTLADQSVGGYWVVDVDGEEPVTTYTVTFSYTVPGAESATERSVDVEDGTLLAELEWPALPSVSGYTAAWPTYAEGASVTEDVTYTATYSANTYTVTFYTNSVEYATANYTYGDASTYTAPADPVVDGFTFGGWFTDNGTFETAFVFSADVAADTQVAYAKLTAVQPPEDEYPSYIPTEDAAAKAKYDSWATYAGVTTAAAAEELEESYLLNCKPDEVAAAKAAFKFTSITKDGDTWVTTTTTSYNNREYNGTVTVKSYSDVECKTESETGTFFRATLQ